MQGYLAEEKRFRSPYAPHFNVHAARVQSKLLKADQRPVYVMGKGVSDDDAKVRLLGEAAERVSLRLFEQTHRAPPVLYPEDGSSQNGVLSTGQPHGSHGCAAHNHMQTAACSAICELWERRLVDDWWQNKRSLLELSRENLDQWGVSTFLKGARTGAISHRHTRFFAVDGPSPVNVCAALSFDRSHRQFAIGFSAGPDLVATLKRSVEELLSVELETADLYGAYLRGEDIEDGSPRARVLARQQALAARFSGQHVMDVWSEPQVPQKSGALKQMLQYSENMECAVTLFDMTAQKVGIPVCKAAFVDQNRNIFFYDQSVAQPV